MSELLELIGILLMIGLGIPVLAYIIAVFSFIIYQMWAVMIKAIIYGLKTLFK